MHELIDNNRLGQSVVDDIRFLRSSPLIRKELALKGFVYHIDTGLLEEIDSAEHNIHRETGRI